MDGLRTNEDETLYTDRTDCAHNRTVLFDPFALGDPRLVADHGLSLDERQCSGSPAEPAVLNVPGPRTQFPMADRADSEAETESEGTSKWHRLDVQ